VRYIGFVLLCLFTTSVLADASERNVVGKLNVLAKPQVRVMTQHERRVAAQNSLAMNLDVSPDQVICRKEKASRDSASKLKVKRCKTRAEFRQEDMERLNASGAVFDQSRLRQNYQRQIRARAQTRQRVRTK